jgi:transposase-like protein
MELAELVSADLVNRLGDSVAERGRSTEPGLAAPEAPLTVAAVAARLGVAPSTLRTWDRRYGLGPSGRAAGSHRRYTADDVARLEEMRRLTLAGAAPSDAARVAAEGVPSPTSMAPFVPNATDLGVPDVLADPLSVAAAAVAADVPCLRRMLATAVREHGLLAMWTEVALPALDILASRDVADRPGSDPEWFLVGGVLATAQVATAQLAPAGSTAHTAGRAQVVVFADAGRTGDRVGAHVLAAALAERGASARVLHSVTEPGRALRVVETLEAGVVAIVGNPACAQDVARALVDRGGVATLFIGPDAPEVFLPGVQRVRTYAGALHEILGAL